MQFGFGMAMATIQRRNALASAVDAALAPESGVPMSAPLRGALTAWRDGYDDADRASAAAKALAPLFAEEAASHPMLAEVAKRSDLLEKPSVWIVGGDGWAYGTLETQGWKASR